MAVTDQRRVSNVFLDPGMDLSCHMIYTLYGVTTYWIGDDIFRTEDHNDCGL